MFISNYFLLSKKFKGCWKIWATHTRLKVNEVHKSHSPGMGTTSSPWWRIHASASCAGVHRCFSANFPNRKKRALFWSKFSPWNLGFAFWQKVKISHQSKLNLTSNKRKTITCNKPKNICLYRCTDKEWKTSYIPKNYLQVYFLWLLCHQKIHGQEGCMVLFQFQAPCTFWHISLKDTFHGTVWCSNKL